MCYDCIHSYLESGLNKRPQMHSATDFFGRADPVHENEHFLSFTAMQVLLFSFETAISVLRPHT